MNLVFAGTPEFAVPTLRQLVDSQHELCAVYTQPDRPAGRGRQLQASPVKQLAVEHDIPVMQPVNFRDKAAVSELKEWAPDLMIVVAYGLILPPEVLAIPRLGCLNVHASLLPRWRGAAPIQRAILAGDNETGITIMQMDAGLDTGDMLLRESMVLKPDMTAAQLHDELAMSGASVLLSVVDAAAGGQLPEAEKQDDTLATYAAKLSKQEALIDWKLESDEIMRRIKAFNPWPVAHTTFEGRSMRIWDAVAKEGNGQHSSPGSVVAIEGGCPLVACAQGVIKLLEIQPEGKRRMTAQAFTHARRDTLDAGAVFGQ